jgi:hypothetical protein
LRPFPATKDNINVGLQTDPSRPPHPQKALKTIVEHFFFNERRRQKIMVRKKTIVEKKMKIKNERRRKK